MLLSITDLAQDLRFAVRVWRRRPGGTLVAIFTMALGIGATTVLFSVADGVLFEPLPWPDSHRLVRLSETRQGGSNRLTGILTNGTYLAWAESSVALDALAAWQGDTATLTGRGEPERVRVAAVTPSLFPLLGARPVRGTLFGPDEDRSASVVLSYGLWQQRFGGSDGALGELLELDGESYRMVAVMPADFAFPDRDTRAWVPFYVGPVVGEDPEVRSLSMFRAIGRLSAGSSPAQAAAEGTARGRAAPDPGMVATAVFGSDGPVEVAAEPLLAAMTADVRPAILIFLAAVGLLYIAATANVVNLLLAGAAVRQREVAIRAALGAGRRHLARQLLVEGTLLGVAGGTTGLALTAMLSGAARRWLLPADLPRLDEVSLDLRVLSFTVALSLLTGVVLGLVPLWYSRRLDLSASLSEGGLAAAAAVGRSGVARARALVMASQVAVACLLLVGAALLGRSFAAMLDADRGYDPSNVATARLILPEMRYTGLQRAALLSSTVERLRALPGVRAAGVINNLPLTGGAAMMAFSLPSAADPEARAQALVRVVSPGYLGALGLRVVEGRGLADSDRLGSPPVMLVNETFARRYLGERRLGARLPVRYDEEHPDVEVVGVLADMRHGSDDDPSQSEIYLPFAQQAEGYGSSEAYIVVRAESDASATVPLLRDVVREADPQLALESVMTMDDRVWSSLERPRRYAALLAAFGACALAIAGAGVFGLLSYSVARRRREIGVRAALGASARDIVGLVVRQGLGVVLAGLALGLGASLGLARLLESLLFGVSARDPLSFVAAAVTLLLVALAACVLPAARAARVDPQRVLRAE